MKKTIGLILLSIFTLLSSNSFAQDKKVQLGVKAGANISNFQKNITGNSAKVGFNVGVTLDYAFSESLYFMTALEATSKGSKFKNISAVDYNGNVLSGDLTYNPIYLQIPLHLGYKINITENAKWVVHVGPYLAYGIAGKLKGKSEGVTESIDVFSTGGMKEFDFGLGLGTGFEFGEIGVDLGYDFGLLNVIDMEGAKTKNGNFSVSLGYKF